MDVVDVFQHLEALDISYIVVLSELQEQAVYKSRDLLLISPCDFFESLLGLESLDKI